MSFELSGKVEDKIYDIFGNIKEKSDIDSNICGGQSEKTSIKYLRTTVFVRALFETDDYCKIPSEKIGYSCNLIIQIQSVYHTTQDKDRDVVYYSQVLLNQCCYELFVDTREIDPHLKRKKVDSCLKCKKKSELEPEPKFEFESEPEINENTTFDE